jgi:tRNA (adenine58-N1)-methyltransferase non-catalytic subunit
MLQEEGESIVSAQSYVIAHCGSDKRVFFHVKPGAEIKTEKKKLRVICDPAIGNPYGTIFRVDVENNIGNLVEIPASESVYHSSASAITDSTFIPDADNSALVDDNSAQLLTAEQIESLKNELQGSKLVEALAANSATFERKTEFSQEKYLSKKKKKYISEVKLLKTTAYTLGEAYFRKKPANCLYMRPDTLAMLLSRANLRVNRFNQVLVFDTASSLVLAALAERMGSFENGRILSGFAGVSPTPDALRMLNIPKGNLEQLVYYFPLSCVRNAIQAISDPSSNVTIDQFVSASSSKKSDEFVHNSIALGKYYLHKEKSDSLVLATHLDVRSCFWELFPLLKCSGSFVVYFNSIEPLNEIAFKLKSDFLAVNVQVSENWYREYQVLPSRTHPKMSMSATGGYLLTGIKINPEKILPNK